MRDQIPEPHASERPRLGEGAEEEQVRVAIEQRPVVEAAELAVGVVEQERRVERLEQPLDLLHGRRGAGRVVGRAQEQRTAGVARDLGLELLDLQPQVGARREEPRASTGAAHEHLVETERGQDAEHLGARPHQPFERDAEHLVRAVADQDPLHRPVQPLGERAPQLVGVEVRVARPVDGGEPRQRLALQARRKVPGHLVLIELEAARRLLERVGVELAQLGAHEARRGAGRPHRLRLHRNLRRAAAACACRPSTSASVAAVSAHARAASGV